MPSKTVNNNTLEVPTIDSKKVEVKIGTILRLLFLIAAYVNQACDVLGAYDAFIPEEYRSVVSVASLVATAVASIAAYWFNNSWSAEATVVDKLLATIKHASKYCPEIVDAVNTSISEFNKKEVAAAQSLSIPTSAEINKVEEKKPATKTTSTTPKKTTTKSSSTKKKETVE